MRQDRGVALLLLGTIAIPTIAITGCVEQPSANIQTGTLLAAAPAQQASENSGVGAMSGFALGAIAGGALGRGAGRVVGAAIGAEVGGVAGSAAEGAAQSTRGVAYTVRLADGQVLTVIQHLGAGQAMLGPGQSVIVRIQGRVQWVEAAG